MESLAHILVVDDHREIRDLLAKYLAKHGFRVSAAAEAAGCAGPSTVSSRCQWGTAVAAPAPAGEHAAAGHYAYPQGRGPGIRPGHRPKAECAGLQLPRDGQS